MKNFNLALLVGLISFGSMAFSQAQAEQQPPKAAPAPQEEYFPDSQWGKPPVKVTKELVCLQHPDLCPKKAEEKQPAKSAE